jgi:DNA-directed RNA polymerase subunit omega
MNIELTKRALEKVGNPHILVNLISRRVRQLNSGGGGVSRPLVTVTPGMGAADIALLELIEDKIGWENPGELPVEALPTPKRRRKATAA